MLTRQWFHVGLSRLDDLSNLPSSYGVEAPRRGILASIAIPLSGFNAAVGKEAYRALASRERQTEIFLASTPWTQSPPPPT